jgi:FixJ family two-component response regulator
MVSRRYVPCLADTICLLDDEPSVLKALGRLLASEGLPAQRFDDPARFLEYARSHPMRLVVIDICMPEMNGLEVLAKLRVSSPDTRVIIITGENDAAYRDAALAAGASAFFFKPFDDRAFLASVRKAILPLA